LNRINVETRTASQQFILLSLTAENNAVVIVLRFITKYTIRQCETNDKRCWNIEISLLYFSFWYKPNFSHHFRVLYFVMLRFS